jgi:hypothetical protein
MRASTDIWRHLILPPFPDRFTRRRPEGQRKQLALAH